jgi:hypothetical protein
MIYQEPQAMANPVFIPTVANIATVQGTAQDYAVPSVRVAGNSENTHTMGRQGYARHNWASLSTEEKQARREARQAHWNSLTDEQKAEKRAARQARREARNQ